MAELRKIVLDVPLNIIPSKSGATACVIFSNGVYQWLYPAGWHSSVFVYSLNRPTLLERLPAFVPFMDAAFAELGVKVNETP